MQAQDYWTQQANKFTTFYAKHQIVWWKKLTVSAFLKARTNRALKLINWTKNDIVLDLGCGSAEQMKLLAPGCKKIVGVDISSQMLKRAKKELGQTNLRNWELIKADAQKLPFKNDSFNRIVSLGLLDYVDFPKKALGECHRVLSGGGQIVFTLPKKPSLFSPLRSSIGNVIKDKVFDLPAIKNVLSWSQLQTLLRKTGFTPIKISSLWTTMWIIKARKSN